MQKELGVTITKYSFIPQLELGSDGIPPRKGIRISGGLYDDVPESFKKAFKSKDVLDPTLNPVKLTKRIEKGIFFISTHYSPETKRVSS